jgi:hypothetical protein
VDQLGAAAALNMTRGCIRMHNEDITDLFAVDVGTPLSRLMSDPLGADISEDAHAAREIRDRLCCFVIRPRRGKDVVADSSARDLGLGRRPSDPRGAVCGQRATSSSPPACARS